MFMPRLALAREAEAREASEAPREWPVIVRA